MWAGVVLLLLNVNFTVKSRLYNLGGLTFIGLPIISIKYLTTAVIHGLIVSQMNTLFPFLCI